MRLCKDCKYFTPFDDTCLKSPKTPDFVYGEVVGYHKAQIERVTIRGCGEDGIWWEPVESKT